MFDDITLDNGIVRAVIDSSSGRVKSFTDLKSGAELLQQGKTAGLEYLETESATSSAWNIGRVLKDTPIDRCTELKMIDDGELRQSAKAVFSFEGTNKAPSTFELTYSLDKGSATLRVDMKIDWQEQGADIIPVLAWKVSVSDMTGSFDYLIPAGSKTRGALNNDVPGIGCGAALRGDGSRLSLLSDCKYGYRGQKDCFCITLINSSVNPDPYPERGEHRISLFMDASCRDAKDMQLLSDKLSRPPMYCSTNVHKGSLGCEYSLMELVSGSVAVTSVRPINGGMLVRGYEALGVSGEARIRINAKSAEMTELSGISHHGQAEIKDGMLSFPVRAHGIWEVKITLYDGEALCRRISGNDYLSVITTIGQQSRIRRQTNICAGGRKQ